MLLRFSTPQLQMASYSELLAQKKALDAQIAQARKQASEAALVTVKQLVEEFGFTAQQVFPWQPEPRKAPAKYLNPVTGATWSGRGKPPKWIAGKDREAFAI
ncbi:H-NS histone family protein [Paracidovorax wautersii]|uniref:DNA-binding protein H-NS n=1 Tax=Paracidovorax wautersii TaxID=1177982 RepID=A0ABU1I9D0_9BURK|nr:H-NS histone family protein [Paracidovorax wautersii]MDR6213591.1 DNA-binding protein H-NS [Paracidovorax wautersii]